MRNFLHILESLETKENKTTIDAIREGYLAFEASYQPEAHFGGDVQRIFTDIGRLLEQFGYHALVSVIDIVVKKMSKTENVDKKISLVNEFRELVDEEIFNAPELIQAIDSRLSELLSTF